MRQDVPDEPEILGFVDIGTNSVRLLVARVHPDHTWTTITLQKESVRLGEGEFGATSRLQPEAMSRAIVVCRTFVDLARAHGARGMVAVATAATREAENRAAFVRRLHDEAGLDVHIVSGQEEARLIFLGVLTRVKLGERRALVIDIGGGSTEVALGDSDGAEYPDSLKIGAIRLTNQYLEGATGPIAAEVYESHAASCAAGGGAHATEALRTAHRHRLRHVGNDPQPGGHRRAPRQRRSSTPRHSPPRRPAQGRQAPALRGPRGSSRRTRLEPGTRRHHHRRRRHPRSADGRSRPARDPGSGGMRAAGRPRSRPPRANDDYGARPRAERARAERAAARALDGIR